MLDFKSVPNAPLPGMDLKSSALAQGSSNKENVGKDKENMGGEDNDDQVWTLTQFFTVSFL